MRSDWSPGSARRYRISYADAISRTWKDEMLLNLVKLRYADAPIFLELKVQSGRESRWDGSRVRSRD